MKSNDENKRFEGTIERVIGILTTSFIFSMIACVLLLVDFCIGFLIKG